jgi:hypothetical protein
VTTLQPGAPFWAGFTAFCANEVAQFALDKLGVLTIERFWVATLGSLFVAGAVYGREKVAETNRRKNGNGPGSYTTAI